MSFAPLSILIPFSVAVLDFFARYFTAPDRLNKVKRFFERGYWIFSVKEMFRLKLSAFGVFCAWTTERTSTKKGRMNLYAVFAQNSNKKKTALLSILKSLVFSSKLLKIRRITLWLFCFFLFGTFSYISIHIFSLRVRAMAGWTINKRW